MSNQIYYGSSYPSGVSGYSLLSANPYLTAAVVSSRHSTDGRAIADINERVSSLYTSQISGLKVPSSDINGVVGAGNYFVGNFGVNPTSLTWPEVDGLSDAGSKRSAEALYNQSIMAHNTIGQNDALLSAYSLLKRPRVVSASHLPIYPQRPGEKDCAHYMMTRTCKFGDVCKFDHPIWVPEGGIPDWKERDHKLTDGVPTENILIKIQAVEHKKHEVPIFPATEYLPERPGEPDCPYFLKTQKCKYGMNCKFNHPKGILNSPTDVSDVNSELPERPSEPICSFYAKTGICKYGGTCKFNHPKDIVCVAKDDAASGDINHMRTFVPSTPALWHNSKGLPIRPGEVECPFYLKTGSCKYGASCRYSHPDRYFINTPVTASINTAMMAPTAASIPIGVINSTSTLFPTLDPHFAQLGVGPTTYPQRPGEIECDHYMKTGQCKFAERCRFHHPIDRSVSTAAAIKQAQLAVKLSLAGLPRREGSVACPFYMKTGTCKYGALCKFDHPPPGEAICLAGNPDTAAEVNAAEMSH